MRNHETTLTEMSGNARKSVHPGLQMVPNAASCSNSGPVIDDTGDWRASVPAFNEKRNPRFKGQ